MFPFPAWDTLQSRSGHRIFFLQSLANCRCCLDHFLRTVHHPHRLTKGTEGQTVLFLSRCYIIPPQSRHATPLTDSSVVHSRVVHPAEGLFHLALQGDGWLGRSHVGHSTVGFGLEGQQCRSNLLCQCTGLWTITFTPEREKNNIREMTGDKKIQKDGS